MNPSFHSSPSDKKISPTVAFLPIAEPPEFASRLSVPSRDAVAPEDSQALSPTLAQMQAFKLVVSAACYLSLSSSANVDATLEATLEAVQILHDCSQEMVREGLELGSNPDESEDLIWRDRQARWERRYAGAHAAEPASAPAPQKARSNSGAAAFAAAASVNSATKCFCTSCKDYSMRRTERKGFWTRSVMSHFGFFPWECAFCRKVTLLRQRQAMAAMQPANVQHIPWHLDSRTTR